VDRHGPAVSGHALPRAKWRASLTIRFSCILGVTRVHGSRRRSVADSSTRLARGLCTIKPDQETLQIEIGGSITRSIS
jgi:hypothetical protein